MYDWAMGEKCFQNAYEYSNLNFDLTGVRGKRTRYQQNDIAQLILKIHKLTDKIDEDFVYSNRNLKHELLPKV
jgi:hypothetical protein